MPKVETSLMEGGEFSNKRNHVSLENGIENVKQNYFIRNKRELQTVISDQNIRNYSLRTRKVLKKLVRVQPLRNDLIENSYEMNQKTETSTRRLRRRLKIKKKKKIRLISSAGFQNEEHLQQATKPRRKVVVTRKRLLLSKSEYNKTKTHDDILHPSVTNLLITSLTQDVHKSYLDHSSYKEEITDDHSPEESSVTEEDNLTESYEATTNEEDIYDFDTEANFLYDDSSEENSFDDLNNPLGDKPDQMTENTSSSGKLVDTTDDEVESNNQPTFQNIPDYEPSFPELTESPDAPLLLLKTTVLSSVDYLTKTTIQSRLRTYTFVVTRLSGDEEIVTSTTEVKPQIKTTVVTEPFTTYTTLTLLDFDATDDVTVKETKLPNLDSFSSLLLNQGEFSFV